MFPRGIHHFRACHRPASAARGPAWTPALPGPRRTRLTTGWRIYGGKMMGKCTLMGRSAIWCWKIWENCDFMVEENALWWCEITDWWWYTLFMWMVISIAGLKDVDKFPWNEFVTWGSHPNSQFQPPGCHQFHQPMKDCETPSLEASPPQSVSVHQLLPARPGMRSWSRPSGRNVCQKKTGETDLCTYPLSKFQMEPLLKMSWEMSLPPGKWTLWGFTLHFLRLLCFTGGSHGGCLMVWTWLDRASAWALGYCRLKLE